MQHVWSILCEQSVIDSESHLISLINCIEEIEVKLEHKLEGKVTIPVRFQLTSFWIKNNNVEPADLDLKIELVDPDKNIAMSFANTFPVAKEFIRFRTRMNIQGMEITMGGRHMLRVSRKGEQGTYEAVGEVPIDIRVVEGQ